MKEVKLDYRKQQVIDEKELKSIFKNESINVVGQNPFLINFAHPLNTTITEEQIEKALKIGYRLTQIEAVVNHSGMKDHLHIWLKKIQDWEKKNESN